MKESTKNNRGITPEQQQAILLLVEGRKINAVAKTLNISRNTISGWLKQKTFMTEFDRILNEFAVSSMLNLAGASEDAARFLRDLVNNKEAKYEVRLKAAMGIFNALENAVTIRLTHEVNELKELVEKKNS